MPAESHTRCWRVEFWVQPIPSVIEMWTGARDGPWFHYETLELIGWAQIFAQAALWERLGGMWTRSQLRIEELEYDSASEDWFPADRV